MFKDAKESLILRRDTHLDQLTDKLKEERVRNIVQPILKGEDSLSEFNDNDLLYLIDLGLVNKLTGGKVEIANKIDFRKLLKAFQEFFQETSEIWIDQFAYREAGPPSFSSRHFYNV
jgi:hypothetical protein